MRKWAHLSVVKRIEVIRRKWRVDVSYWRLRQFYAQHKIKWRRAYYTMKAATKDQEFLMNWRKEFAVKLKAIKEAQEPLIYFDEVSNL